MLAWLTRRGNQRRTARSLYGSIVTQARSQSLYAGAGVPDTAEGRFEMIVLHLVLVLRRLAREGPSSHRLGQALTEVFVVDLDDTLREMTVGDLAVPRHVKRAVAVLHDRYETYSTALASPQDGPLTTAIRGRIATLRGTEALDAAQICAYIREAARALDLLSGAELLAGRLAWPQAHMRKQGAPTAAG